MNATLSISDHAEFRSVVKDADLAAFNGVVVHAVCSTFALARDFEWTSRQILLKILKPDEEGVGTVVHVDHVAPAFLGEEITFNATLIHWDHHDMTCLVEATVGKRVIATGITGQKLLKKKKLAKLFRQK